MIKQVIFSVKGNLAFSEWLNRIAKAYEKLYADHGLAADTLVLSRPDFYYLMELTEGGSDTEIPPTIGPLSISIRPMKRGYAAVEQRNQLRTSTPSDPIR